MGGLLYRLILPINLSILDFKSGKEVERLEASLAINLSILDFKFVCNTAIGTYKKFYKSLHTGF